jgi:cobalt-zinc-cadmium resistance protein CzcA
MIEKIIQFSLKQRLFIVLATVLTAVLGYTAYRSLAIDVFPDPSPPLVQIYTEAHGMAPEEVERLISYPLESSMFGLPKVRNIRSVSSYALSIVNIYFEDKTDIYWARQLVAQRVLETRDQLPEHAHNPVLGPIATGLGLVYLYYLEGEGHSALELRTLQDWLIKYELKSVPEVSQVLRSSSSRSWWTPGLSSSTTCPWPSSWTRFAGTTRTWAPASSPKDRKSSSSAPWAWPRP